MDTETLRTSDFSCFAAAAGLPVEARTVWGGGWAESQESFAEADLGFLEAAFVSDWSARLRMAEDVRGVLLEGSRHIRASAELTRLAWHLYRLMYVSPGLLQAGVPTWPMLPSGICPLSDLFYAFLFLAGLPLLARQYKRRRIPFAVLRETLSDLELWIREHRGKTGRWGLSEHKWLIQHVSGNLFQLGRLQFQFGTYRYAYSAYRHRHSRQVVVFPADGLPLTGEGYIAGSSEEAAGRTRFAADSAGISGTPVAASGRVCAELVSLPSGIWEPILRQGDSVLNIHIPAGAPMSHDSCGDSFCRAQRFFPDCFPEFCSRAYACTSWLLDPQLADYLAPTSNMVRFQEEVYLVPVPGTDGRQTISRVFGTAEVDPASAPRRTSLQKAVLDHLERGGTWRQGACLLFPEDLDWGSRAYRGGARALRT